MAESIIDDELWQDFHTVVNMTSRELREWLMVQAASEVGESLPEQSGNEMGHRVLSILAKRRADLTPDDVEVMDQVVETITSQRDVDLEPTAGDAAWRHDLMNLGHDPLKPV